MAEKDFKSRFWINKRMTKVLKYIYIYIIVRLIKCTKKLQKM